MYAPPVSVIVQVALQERVKVCHSVRLAGFIIIFAKFGSEFCRSPDFCHSVTSWVSLREVSFDPASPFSTLQMNSKSSIVAGFAVSFLSLWRLPLPSTHDPKNSRSLAFPRGMDLL
jgi:hypothetical protein